MQSLRSNDIKIYNISAGKSVPEWINDRERRKQEQKDVDLRRRIQLIQDFEMPDVSNAIALSRDGRYCFASGSYKPFFKCYDLHDLSMKWERGVDNEVIKICPIGDDYGKVALLEEDRYLELHSAKGRFFKMRVPKFGRDICLSREAADLCIVGSGSDVFRLNLEEGKFLEPFVTESRSLTCCKVSEEHQLFLVGTDDGKVEAWDHRDRSRAGVLDCALSQFMESGTTAFGNTLPEVSCIEFKDGITFGVGTSTGHALIYDLRSSGAILSKDLQMGLPVKGLSFVAESNLAISMDSQVVKVWNSNDGTPYCAVEPGVQLNAFVRYPDSGLLFFANEGKKMQQFFIPALGTAPKWCSYLETITEELEETDQAVVYDDFQFVTKEQLEQLGLTDLIGSNVVKAYMHGYYMDRRLYNKAFTLTQPFAYENYKDRKLKEHLEEERAGPAIVKKEKLPSVNRMLARKLKAEQEADTSNAKHKFAEQKTKVRSDAATELLEDTRFKDLFIDPEFEVDERSEQYQKMIPVLEHLKKISKVDDKEMEVVQAGVFEQENSDEGSDASSNSDDEEMLSEDSQGSEVDEPMVEVKAKVERPKRIKPKSFKMVGLESQKDFGYYSQKVNKDAGNQLMGAKRKEVAESNEGISEDVGFGGKSMSFPMKPSAVMLEKNKKAEEMKKHAQERAKVARGVQTIAGDFKKMPVNPKFKKGGKKK
uniref:NUC153 domain-containing protein n=1 Tax=Rhabditophanes sp. KR3021 TaxID=114890 RepID=A0AC35TGB5_9BILA